MRTVSLAAIGTYSSLHLDASDRPHHCPNSFLFIIVCFWPVIENISRHFNVEDSLFPMHISSMIGEYRL